LTRNADRKAAYLLYFRGQAALFAEIMLFGIRDRCLLCLEYVHVSY